MISDEGQQSAAYAMRDAAEVNMRAANEFSEAVRQLGFLLGQGYGSNIDFLIEELKKFNEQSTSRLPQP